ncbi:hypothetical protein [Nitrososphaera sp. AFS]|jgi:hypothetical protein|uniref:hypothetical protein n=1 Tax=Nitrososphaera sp. AFS TaxID=2301191 RepID=UPI00139247FF|nr:hypothetical protein [Nitrososphaera sp. AFS]NAL77026.1 hypothetical protein [Nitrososphaera sp. AFS]
MYPQKHLQRRKISEALVIVALALVLIYIADAAVGQGKQGFLPLSAALRGMLFGASSIILFFASFGVGFGQKSKITTYLLIAGGAITGTSVLGAASMAKGGLPAIQASFLAIVIVGYIILGLGIFRLVRKL